MSTQSWSFERRVDMIREVFITVIVIAAKLYAEASTCDDCTNTYETAKGDENVDKCSALKNYLTCLETASGAGCPLLTAKAEAIRNDYTAISGDCDLSELCTCQKDYWGTDITADNTVKCNTAKTRANCLRGKTDTACDGSSTAANVGTTTVAILEGLTTCDSASTCACEVTHFTADVSSDENKCTVNKNFISCLVGKTEVGCASGSIVKDLATAAESEMGATCAKSAVCICEIDYTKADQSTVEDKCTVNKNFISCLVGKTEVGCASGSVVKDLATIAESKMGENCDKSAVCSCEIEFTKADQSTEAKKCTSANEFLSCLDEINSADDKGCNGTVTAASLKSYVELKIETMFCSSAGFQAEISFTIVCLLLTVSAIFST